MVEPHPSDLEQRLSFSERYENLGLIGSGGQGKVYKVQDKANGEVLAAKRIGLDSWEEVRRLEDEVRALRQLQHPTIVAYEGSYTETDRWNDPEFILLMEHVDGKPLAQYLAQGKTFSEEELLTIKKQLQEGLAAAHTAGIVHRDIKPQNILRKDDGTVKITDYGLAKFLNEGTRSTSLGKGTIYYMAPEQINGGRIKPETDYYGLGLTLLSLAIGKEREDDIRHQKPKDDIAQLRSWGKYSSAFLDSLELLVDEDAKKRKEGLVVKVVEPIVEQRDLETVVGGKKTYEELVKWKKSFWGLFYGGSVGMVSGILLSVGPLFVGSKPPFSNDWTFFYLGSSGLGGYIGYYADRFTNWRRRRKAEKAAGVTTIKHYDAKVRRGTKKDTTLVGLLVDGEQYVIDTRDLQCFTEMVFHRVYHGEKDLSFAYQVSAHDAKKKSAKVLTVTDPPLLQKIQQEVNRIREHEENLLPGPWRRPDPIHTVRVAGESATPRKSPKARGKGSVNWPFAEEIFGSEAVGQYKRAKEEERQQEQEEAPHKK